MADTSSPPPGQPPAPQDTPAALPIVVKKYANRRLYNTETSSYITLDNLAEMIRAGRDFVVYDAKSGEDITRGVLTQIIVEEESKGSAMLPTAFLRQLIGFYGGNLQGVVPRYLEHAMSSFARQQQQVRHMLERTLSPFLPTGVEEMSRQNMAIFERALTMWNPFHRSEPETQAGEAAPAGQAEDQAELARLRQEVDTLRHQQQAAPAPAPVDQGEVERLRQEVESLKQQLAAAHASAVVPEAATAIVPSAAPENVLADSVPAGSSNGAVRAPRRAGPRKPGLTPS